MRKLKGMALKSYQRSPCIKQSIILILIPFMVLISIFRIVNNIQVCTSKVWSSPICFHFLADVCELLPWLIEIGIFILKGHLLCSLPHSHLLKQLLHFQPSFGSEFIFKLNVILLYSDAVSQTNVIGNIATFISPIVENCLYGATSNIILKFGGIHVYYPLKIGIRLQYWQCLGWNCFSCCKQIIVL